MPHFYNHKNTNDFGKVTITPKGIRRIKLGDFSIWPYVTMSKIRFTVTVEKFPQRNGINKKDYNAYIKLGDGSYRTLVTLTHESTPVEGTAEYTGDTKIFLASSNYSFDSAQKFIAKEGLLLFDANVLSKDGFVWGGCSVAALAITILSVLFAWLLGFIQIVPERVVWWPW